MYQCEVHCLGKVHGRDTSSELHGSGKVSQRPKECRGGVKEVEDEYTWEKNEFISFFHYLICPFMEELNSEYFTCSSYQIIVCSCT